MTHKIENQLEEIQSFISQQTLVKKDILTLAEAAAYTGLSKSFLYKKTSLRQITFYKLEGKLLYFKKSELEEYILANRLAPISEVVDEKTFDSKEQQEVMKRKIKMSVMQKSLMQLVISSEFKLESRSVTDTLLFKTLSANEHLVQFVDENLNSAVTSNGISLNFYRGTQTYKNYKFCEFGSSWKYSINEDVEKFVEMLES